jgi:DNA-binding beta-propeller fold protein YncE
VPAAGGATAEVAVGQPFVAPRGLAIGTDGQQIYVADPQATGADGRTGRIFVLPASGGAPTALAGTEGTAPRGLEVVRENGADVLYFAGVDPTSGQPAVMKLVPSGAGSISVIAKGAPLVEPIGIAVTKGGIVYVADRLASGNDLGSVFRINGTAVLEQQSCPWPTA